MTVTVDKSYIINSRLQYGITIGKTADGRDVIFTDDFEKFIDDLLRTLSANFQAISEIFAALGVDPEGIGIIIKSGLSSDVSRQFFEVETDDDPPSLPEVANAEAFSTIRAVRSDGSLQDYHYTPD